MTDQEILEHLRNNKYSVALKGLYNLLPQVKKHIVQNSGTTSDAEDVFQDALVILYKKVHSQSFQLTAPLQYYVLAIAKNCWHQQLRQRNKFPTVVGAKELPLDESTEEPGFMTATAAFHLLGEKCKQLLILFYFKKKDYKEIALALSFSDEKIAKNQKYRCLQKAKENYVTLSKNGEYE